MPSAILRDYESVNQIVNHPKIFGDFQDLRRGKLNNLAAALTAWVLCAHSRAVYAQSTGGRFTR